MDTQSTAESSDPNLQGQRKIDFFLENDLSDLIIQTFLEHTEFAPKTFAKPPENLPIDLINSWKLAHASHGLLGEVLELEEEVSNLKRRAEEMGDILYYLAMITGLTPGASLILKTCTIKEVLNDSWRKLIEAEDNFERILRVPFEYLTNLIKKRVFYQNPNIDDLDIAKLIYLCLVVLHLDNKLGQMAVLRLTSSLDEKLSEDQKSRLRQMLYPDYLDLPSIIRANQKKLITRYPKGTFDLGDSVERADTNTEASNS